MRSLGVLTGLVLLVAIASPVGRARAEPAAQELLAVTGDLTYDVRLDEGPAIVTWNLTVTNNDPNTTFNQFGVSQFYQGVGLPVLRGAAALRATGPGGALTTGLEDPDDPVLQVATVQFDRNLFYGDTYSFTLTYQLDDVQSDFILVSESYAFFPAISLGDTTVRVLTPAGAAWNVSLEDGGECEPLAPARYDCLGTFEFAQLVALVEVSRPDRFESRSLDIDLEEQTLSITIRAFPGQDAWVDHAETIATAALPVLEDLFGFAYTGPDTLEIAQSARRDIFGYEGVFWCATAECNIGVLPVAGDHVLLHELAHMWTTGYRDRWLAEGFAELMARRARTRLADIVGDGEVPPFERYVELQLDSWGPTSYLLSATREQQEREISGYALALDFVGELEEAVGLEALQEAGAAAHERGLVGSRRYFDMLEDASGQNLEVLFRERVFLPNSIALLKDRRAARERFADLEDAVEQARLELPSRIASLTGAWLFDDANAVMLDAEVALEVLADARDDVERSRNVWQRIGLIGADPEQAIRLAEAAFSRGDYVSSKEHARDAARTIDDANRTALVRVLIVLGVAAAVAVVLGLVVLAVVRGRRAVGG